MVTIKEILDARLRKCLEKLQAEADDCRAWAKRTADCFSRTATDNRAKAEALEWAIDEIRAAVGMEENDGEAD